MNMKPSRAIAAAFILSSTSFAALAESRPARESASPGERTSLGFAAAPDFGSASPSADSFGYAPLPTKAPPRDPAREQPPAPPSNNVTIFGGQYTTDSIVHSLDPFTVRHENQFMVGAAYGHDLYRAPLGFVFGPEIGVGFRFGQGGSQEIWAGFNLRNTGLVLFDFVRIGIGVTVGFSGVNRATGKEAARQSQDQTTNAHFLGYLAPEVVLSPAGSPNWELFYRLQHRSGLYGVIANSIEGANANTIGLRHRF